MRPMKTDGPTHDDLIFVISNKTIIKDEKRADTKIFIEDGNDQKNHVTSCLFQDGEVLDYDLIPTFPNYFYAFTSLFLSDCHSMSYNQKSNGRFKLTRSIAFTLCVLCALAILLVDIRGYFILMYTDNAELHVYMVLLNSSLPLVACCQLLNVILRKRKSLLGVFWHPKLIVRRRDHKSTHNDYNMRKAFRAAKTFKYGVLVIGVVRMLTTGFDETGWSLSELLNSNAETLYAAFPKQPNSETNSTVSEISNVGTELQMETILIGTVAYFLRFSSFVTLSFIGGLFLFAGITMKSVSEIFIAMLQMSGSEGLQIKHTYEFLFRSTYSVNLHIGELLATFHVQVFLYFVLMLRFTVAEGSVFDIYNVIYFFPDVSVTTAAYYYATRIPLQMETFRSWTRKQQNLEKIGLDSVKAQHLLDEMTTDSIGIGKGLFHVNAELIGKLSSCVGTFFLVIAPVNKQ